MPFWFNTKTNQVESQDDPGRARSGDLMGPYDTEAEAARAYELAAEKTAEWDEEERADDAWESGDAERDAWDDNPLNG